MSASADLGGKALNLIRLRDAAFDVPDFIVIPPVEYREFVASAGLAPIIDVALRGLRPGTAEAVSNTIRAAFAASSPTGAQRARLLELVSELGDSPVAIRLSVPELGPSQIADDGQFESFLDVRRAEAVDRIVECWASLWNPRALAARLDNGACNQGLAPAVVVQQTVDADASGVLFTANPLTGHRGEVVIEGACGPTDRSGRGGRDRVVVAAGLVASREIADTPALSDHQARLLAELGGRVQQEFGAPQRIGWVRVADRLRLVSTHPMTSLFPLPEHDAGFAVWLSFGALQGVSEPVTPLGRDVIAAMGAAAARMVGVADGHHEGDYLRVVAERLWLRVDGLLRTQGTRQLLAWAMSIIDPGSAAILDELSQDPRLASATRLPRPASVGRLAAQTGRHLARFPGVLSNPRRARERLDAALTRLVDSVSSGLAAADEVFDPRSRLAARVAVVKRFAEEALPQVMPVYDPIIAASGFLNHRLRQLAERTGLPDAEALVMIALSSPPGDVTVELDFAISDTAAEIRADAPSYGWVVTTPPPLLAEQYRARGLPRAALVAMDSFVDEHGLRGGLDIGTPRWRDDTTEVWRAIASQLAIYDVSLWPRSVQAGGVSRAEDAIERLADASGVRGAEVRRAANTLRELLGARHAPKHAIGRCLGLIRAAVAASAADLAAVGALENADDVFFLTADELPRAFVGGWNDLVAGRRAAFELEGRRSRVPRVLVSDGRAFFDGPAAANNPGPASSWEA